MSKTEKVATLSADAKAVLKVLENSDVALTLAEINAMANAEVKTGTLVSLIKKGMISKGDEKEVSYTAKKFVGTYSFKKSE
jgi:hypothetical protein